jgi:hypothetical protein
MRTRRIFDGQATLTVRRRRATVHIRGRYVGTLVKGDGRWTGPDGYTYLSPAEAAEALLEAA